MYHILFLAIHSSFFKLILSLLSSLCSYHSYHIEADNEISITQEVFSYLELAPPHFVCLDALFRVNSIAVQTPQYKARFKSLSIWASRPLSSRLPFVVLVQLKRPLRKTMKSSLDRVNEVQTKQIPSGVRSADWHFLLLEQIVMKSSHWFHKNSFLLMYLSIFPYISLIFLT